MKRAIVRYALSCPKAEAKQFVERIRITDSEMVKDVEEGLKFEQLPAGK